MQLTRAADYAVRVLVHLAARPRGSRETLSALAGGTEVPEQFLSKVLQQLARAGLVVSHRGGGGGFELALPPRDVTLLDVVEAIEGPIALNFCLMSENACPRSGWCAAHRVWSEAQQAMVEVLRHADLESLAAESAAVKNGSVAWS